ncbi:MAG: DUF3375 domain-containing protein [Gammaproteobacteria bacterium]|nr:MAG: DUF3375 domain-containing protein [Gammaproteobacteria bacterium]RTZ72989.1 MAG: DUF3375 domain-containing protein [Gammaproteobacteria bacterium]RTZ76650.1 MAG: DUF3375 domain-containing protein [Gammaproteobacteria bacterium]
MLLDYDTLERLRRQHPAWRLLQADHAPLIASFLHQAFVASNQRQLSQSQLASKLDDLLYRLRESLGEGAFPRRAEQYLDDWAQDQKGWLRKFYPPNTDEAHFDLTPSTEKALVWLEQLGGRSFVGTESRLLILFELLRQMLEGSETDPEVRIRELERRRDELDAEIERIRNGELELLDDTALRDRFQQFSRSARELLADFREVEQNFRDLDRSIREKIALWEGSKGELLERFFGEHDAIADSDQGRSFRAFWEFLMSPRRQQELDSLLEEVMALEAIQVMHPDARLKRVHYDWLDAGEQTQRTVARLSQQLRRFLDEQAWLENRRIMEVLHRLEGDALAVRENAPTGSFAELEVPGAFLELPMEKPLFQPPFKPHIDDHIELGEGESLDAGVLFDQHWVDKARLAAHLRRALQTRSQVTLGELLESQPLEQGLAELLAWLELAAEADHTLFEESRQERISWQDEAGHWRSATLPQVIFNR